MTGDYRPPRLPNRWEKTRTVLQVIQVILSAIILYKVFGG